MGNLNRINRAAKGAFAGLGMATEALTNATNMAQLPENNYQEQIDDISAQNYNVGSYNELSNLINSTPFAKNTYSTSDILGMSKGEAAGQIISNSLQGAMSGLNAGGFSPAGGIMAGVNAGLQALASGIGYGIRKGKASAQAQQLNHTADIANQFMQAKIERSTDNIGKNMRNIEQLNLAAFGGPLDTTFTNGVRFITEGGSHENNPLSGVPQGIAADGIPNLVEEGEVIYNDYVYSRRLKVPQSDKESLGLKKDKEYTYADAAKQIQKESEERPNDPISKRNLVEMMSRLQGSQEALKEKRDGQALKRAVNNMTPDELAMFMQQLQQPQQMQPMMAMQSMQPMQSTQSEVPMFGKGGHLFALGDNLNVAPIQSPTLTLQIPTIKASDILSSDRTKEIFDRAKKVPGVMPSDSELDIPSNPWAQALRAAPVFGSLASSIASLFDKPNYSNIRRAERAMASVPRVSATHIGQRMAYTPIDINYIATQQANNALGSRRALNEYSAGNPAGIQQAVIANNYANQTALANAIMQANQLNRQNLAQALEFNRQTDSANAASNLQAALANQQRDMNIADFLFRTGQLRDAELGRVQANRSANLTGLFNNLGNLGTDMLNRDMATAMAQSYGVTYNPYMDALRRTYGYRAKGGKLNTKKGGKDA